MFFLKEKLSYRKYDISWAHISDLLLELQSLQTEYT